MDNRQRAIYLSRVRVGIGLAMLMAHALLEPRIGVSVAGSTAGITDNIYRGRFSLMSTGYMV